MDPTVNPNDIETIKALVLTIAGIKNITLADCRPLSFSIIAKTNLGVSELVIKRLFGFAISHFFPSVYTLNALAIYCGHENWDTFCDMFPKSVPKNTLSSDVFDNPLVSSLLETPIPTALISADAPYFTILTYNSAHEDATFIKNRNIKRLTLWNAYDLTEVGGSGPTLLLEAINKAVHSKQVAQVPPLQFSIPSNVLNTRELVWWNIKITPVLYDGFVRYIILNIFNITDRLLHQDAIEEAIMRELTMAEDLAKTNVKLNIAIANLAESYRELTATQNKLEKLNEHLEERVSERTQRLVESEGKQRELINSAPVAIGILKGPDHIIETANKKTLEYWGKDKSVIGLPLAVAIPELEDQPFIAILNEVRTSGIAYVNPELRALLDIDGVLQPRYFDMIYQPIQYIPGITDSIYVVAINITDQVVAREKLKESESMLRLAVEAANIGIWSFDPKTTGLTYNAIFADILGWESPELLTSEQAIGQVTEEFREKLITVVNKSLEDGSDYDLTYRHVRFNDQRVVWLRGTGKVTTNDAGEHCFSGIVRDITDELTDLIQQKRRMDGSLNRPA